MNSKFLRMLLMITIMLVIVSCSGGNPAGSGVDANNAEPAATALPATAAPTATTAPTPTAIVSPSAIPSPTVAPSATTPVPGLDKFVAELETALLNQDADALAGLMNDPFAIGAWRSEWRTMTPQEADSEIINQHTPPGAGPLFSGLSLEEISMLVDGQDPQQMMGPDVTVATVLHGNGWGPAGDEEVLLFIVENEDGAYAWYAFLYAPGSFNPETVEPEYPPLDTLVFTATESISPDGVWTATTQQSEVVNLEDGRQVFYNALSVTDGTTTWEPAGEWRGYGLGVAFLNVYRWGADGRTLFYGNVSVPDGCGLFAYETDLSRLDLETGLVTELLPAYTVWNLNLSPDDSVLAAITWNGERLILNLHNLETETVSQIQLTEPGENAQAGNMVWSPDGERLLLTIAYEPCNQEWAHSTVLVDPAGLTTQILIERDPRLFTISEWSTEDEAILVDDEGNFWQLDVSTGELAPNP